jgi:hypothetical protein
MTANVCHATAWRSIQATPPSRLNPAITRARFQAAYARDRAQEPSPPGFQLGPAGARRAVPWSPVSPVEPVARGACASPGAGPRTRPHARAPCPARARARGPRRVDAGAARRAARAALPADATRPAARSVARHPVSGRAGRRASRGGRDGFEHEADSCCQRCRGRGRISFCDRPEGGTTDETQGPAPGGCTSTGGVVPADQAAMAGIPGPPGAPEPTGSRRGARCVHRLHPRGGAVAALAARPAAPATGQAELSGTPYGFASDSSGQGSRTGRYSPGQSAYASSGSSVSFAADAPYFAATSLAG